MNTRLYFEVSQQADVTIVVLCQDRYVDLDVYSLESGLLDLVRETEPQKLLIDMCAVSMTNGSLNSVLIKAKKAVEHCGGKLKLCNLAPLVVEVFRMLHFVDYLFDIHDTTEGALAAFAV